MGAVRALWRTWALTTDLHLIEAQPWKRGASLPKRRSNCGWPFASIFRSIFRWSAKLTTANRGSRPPPHLVGGRLAIVHPRILLGALISGHEPVRAARSAALRRLAPEGWATTARGALVCMRGRSSPDKSTEGGLHRRRHEDMRMRRRLSKGFSHRLSVNGRRLGHSGVKRPGAQIAKLVRHDSISRGG